MRTAWDGALMVNARVVMDWRLPALALELEALAQTVVDATAAAIRDAAQSYAAVDTGAMQTALYVSTPTDSDYAAVVGQARDLNPRAEVFDELPRPEPGEALIGEAMGYGEYQEYGTRKMAAHPYLTPAAEDARAGFASAIARLLP